MKFIKKISHQIISIDFIIIQNEREIHATQLHLRNRFFCLSMENNLTINFIVKCQRLLQSKVQSKTEKMRGMKERQRGMKERQSGRE